MKKLIIYTFATLAMLHSLPSFAAIIPNTDKNEVSLGKGIRVETEQIFPTCLETFQYDEMIAEDSFGNNRSPKGAKTLEVKSEVIRSYQSLDEYTNESYSADVQYMAASGSAHYNREAHMQLSNDSITVGIKAHANYGRWYIKEPRLKAEFLKLAATNLPAFYKRCGQEFVSGYKLGQGISIILRTQDFSSLNQEKIDSGANASISAASGSASVQAAFLSVANKLLAYGSLEVQIVGYGVNGLSSTSQILKSKKDVESILDVISNMITDLDPNNAVVTHYMTSNYPISDQNYSGVQGEARRQSLSDLYSAYRQIETDLGRLRHYVNVDFKSDYQRLCELTEKETKKIPSCDQYTAYIASEVKNLSQAQDHLIKAIQDCALGDTIKSCRLADLETQIMLAQKSRLWPKQYRRLLEYAKYRRDIREEITRNP